MNDGIFGNESRQSKSTARVGRIVADPTFSIPALITRPTSQSTDGFRSDTLPNLGRTMGDSLLVSKPLYFALLQEISSLARLTNPRLPIRPIPLVEGPFRNFFLYSRFLQPNQGSADASALAEALAPFGRAQRRRRAFKSRFDTVPESVKLRSGVWKRRLNGKDCVVSPSLVGVSPVDLCVARTAAPSAIWRLRRRRLRKKFGDGRSEQLRWRKLVSLAASPDICPSRGRRGARASPEPYFVRNVTQFTERQRERERERENA
eukprot:scaffold1516_cov230-Pinguiococcus_pyrenoidosus.AAC.12